MYIPVTKPPSLIKLQETENDIHLSHLDFSKPDPQRTHDVSKHSDIDTFEGTKLQKVLRESATQSELLETDTENVTDSDSVSLLIPVLILSVIVVITLFLALFRLLHTRFYKDKQESYSR